MSQKTALFETKKAQSMQRQLNYTIWAQVSGFWGFWEFWRKKLHFFIIIFSQNPKKSFFSKFLTILNLTVSGTCSVYSLRHGSYFLLLRNPDQHLQT
jgi:hypothetical protein